MMFAACRARSDNTRKEGTSRALMDLAKVALGISIFEESSLK
jgi:hypothetical protein